MSTNKLKVIRDYEKLDDQLKEQIKLVYPRGFSQHLIQFRNKEGDLISALPFETDEKIYMVRMSVQKANEIISTDDDFDDDGVLKSKVRRKYEENNEDIEYLSENENYDSYSENPEDAPDDDDMVE